MKNIAFGITVFPFSWHLGLWRKPHKTLFAVGPIRFVLHHDVKGRWGSSGGLTVSCDETSRVILDGVKVTYSECSCSRKMGNDFYFLPAGECLRPGKVCDGA